MKRYIFQVTQGKSPHDITFHKNISSVTFLPISFEACLEIPTQQINTPQDKSSQRDHKAAN